MSYNTRRSGRKTKKAKSNNPDDMDPNERAEHFKQLASQLNKDLKNQKKANARMAAGRDPNQDTDDDDDHFVPFDPDFSMENLDLGERNPKVAGNDVAAVSSAFKKCVWVKYKWSSQNKEDEIAYATLDAMNKKGFMLTGNAKEDKGKFMALDFVPLVTDSWLVPPIDNLTPANPVPLTPVFLQ